jgi:hypothetical protein
MNPHRLKCRLSLHDWASESATYDGLVVVEKSCLWCDARSVTSSVVRERRDGAV